MLTYLTTVADVKEEDGIIPQRNAGARSFNRRRSSDGGGDKYYGHDNLRRDETTNYASKRTKKEITSHEFGRNNKKHKEETTFMSDASSTNRLDRIKQGEDVDSTTVRSSAHVTKKQRRGKMMEMKSQMRVERGLSPLKTMEEERFDAEKARTRREERRKRRLKRQKAALGIDYESDEKQENEEEENELETKPQIAGILKNKKSNNEVKSGKTVKLELDLDEQATANTLAIKNEDEQNSEVVNDDAESKKSGIRWANDDNSSELISDKQALVKQTQDHQTPPPLSTSPKKKREHTKVFCPVCQLILTLNHNDDASSPDDFLSKHIDKCQRTKGARGGGRTLRKRTKPAVIDTDEDPYEDGIHAVKEEDPFTPAENSYLDDEVEDDDHKPAARHNPKRGNSISPTPDEDTAIRKTPSSIDDMDEFDYEDRVDDWMENGVKNMRDMAERDTSEIAPGSVVYEGGLEIPAWINDRLFPYQRTGVRWMWELHCQGAGGVGE